MPLRVKSGTTLVSESFWASSRALKPFGSICYFCSAARSSACEASSGTKEEATAAAIARAASPLPPWLGSCCGREGERNIMI